MGMRYLIALVVIAGCNSQAPRLLTESVEFVSGSGSYESFQIQQHAGPVGVSRVRAQELCAALGGGLPTEKQWVIAAHAGFADLDKPINEWFDQGWYVPQNFGGGTIGTFVSDPPPADVHPAFRCAAPLSD